MLPPNGRGAVCRYRCGFMASPTGQLDLAWRLDRNKDHDREAQEVSHPESKWSGAVKLGLNSRGALLGARIDTLSAASPVSQLTRTARAADRLPVDGKPRYVSEAETRQCSLVGCVLSDWAQTKC